MNIKIFVSCDKDSYVPENPYLMPVQVGTSLTNKRYSSMFHDNDGINISEKNRSYCELTAQYWVWKNQVADYYGFFHYRRYLCFDENINCSETDANIRVRDLSDGVLQGYGITAEKIEETVSKYDAIVVQPRNVTSVESIYEEYGNPETQYLSDLDCVLEIIHEKYPQFDKYAKEYLYSKEAYDCNMFIMKNEIFQEYSSWLFDILEEAEKRIDTTHYSNQQYRVYGYLGERLCGIFFTYLKHQDSVKVKELPKLLIENTSKEVEIEQVSDSIPVCISAENTDVPQLSVFLQSLLENTGLKHICDVLVFTKSITDSNKKILNDQIKNTKLLLRFIDVNPILMKYDLIQNELLNGDYRLLIPFLLKNYKKVICMETDMIIQSDLSELYNINIENYMGGACRDIINSGILNQNKFHQKEYLKDVLHIKDPYSYFQDGLLVLNLQKLRECYNIADIKEYLNQSFKYGMQDIWNVLLNNQVYTYPIKWNYVINWYDAYLDTSRMQYIKMADRNLYNEYLESGCCAAVIHFDGYQKPWDCVDCDMAVYFWNNARKSPFYELLMHEVQYSLTRKKYEKALPPVVIHEKKGFESILNSLSERGISCTIIRGIRRIVQSLHN